MHRLLSEVMRRSRLVWLVSALALAAPEAHAQATPPVNSCEPALRELESTKNSLTRLNLELNAARAEAERAVLARATVERLEKELAEQQALINSYKSSSQNMCSSVNTFSQNLAAGRVQTEGLGECLDPASRRSLVEQLSGISNVTSAISQFAAYSAGETDVSPRLGAASGARIERSAARLFASGNGSPLLYRRLLIAAIELLAPRTWSNIKSKPGQIDRWFSSTEALDEALIVEARQEAENDALAPNSTAPLTKALELVSVYELLGSCSSSTPARDCRRAGQLRGMLELNGPLVTRRRIQDVWSSECSTITDVSLRAWFEDLPKTSSSEVGGRSLAANIYSKLLSCFLRDSTAGSSLSGWLGKQLPVDATSKILEHFRAIDAGNNVDSPLSICTKAVRELQDFEKPHACRVEQSFVDHLSRWSAQPPSSDDGSFDVKMCERAARRLWAGDQIAISDTFAAPPTLDDAVRVLEDAPPSNVHQLRDLCDARVGSGKEFSAALFQLSRIAAQLGENPAFSPWFFDVAEQRPKEDEKTKRVQSHTSWLKSLVDKDKACTILELSRQRCMACRELPPDSNYDCAKLLEIQKGWSTKTRLLLLGSALLLLTLGFIAWLFALRRANVRNGPWLAAITRHSERLGFYPLADKLRYFFPSRFDRVIVTIPKEPGWERWGAEALLTRADARLSARDVNRAGSLGLRYGAHLAFLVHDEQVSPDLSAVRSILDWAARGGTKAVHIVPIPWSRIEWSQNATDLLELAEESSLRSNPFEVRGRVTSSSQFFDRERLVSGLLASAQAGHFTVVTGLRRFGKSSLTLEVSRRLPGPSAYVDLAGFHHEIRFSEDPAHAADAILRFVCLQLLESARARFGQELPGAAPDGRMDAATLTAWFLSFFRALSEKTGGKAPPLLIILDEIEQAIGASKELNHALDVFAILVGRLRNSLPGNSTTSGDRVGVIFASALHPLLWSPLVTLAHQSLIGSFQYVSVPSLPEEATAAMMRGLGARQGIRFQDDALDLLVTQSQGVPLLARRLGTAVLELYDADRARQGALGAVEIGVEGVRAALEREEAEGSPLRVWIESEIAEPQSPGGVILRRLAREEKVGAAALRQLATDAFRQQFEITGVALALTQEESQRRAQEAAVVTIRLLGDSGLLVAHGDLTEPESYELPQGIIRRVLRRAG